MAAQTLRRRHHGEDSPPAAGHTASISADRNGEDANSRGSSGAPAKDSGWLHFPNLSAVTNTLPATITAAAGAAVGAAGAVVGAAAAHVRSKTDHKKLDDAPLCHDCSAAFSYRVWRYLCPLCGRSFCGACVPNTQRHAMPHGHEPSASPMCLDCFVNTCSQSCGGRCLRAWNMAALKAAADRKRLGGVGCDAERIVDALCARAAQRAVGPS